MTTTLFQPTSEALPAGVAAPPPPRVSAAPEAPYRGPERRGGAGATTPWLAQMLDEVDYGLLLIVDGSHVLHINHAARAQLGPQHPLQVVGDALRVREAADLPQLHAAIVAARQGHRRLVTLGRGAAAVCIAITPLGALGLGGPPATLLTLGKRTLSTPLTVQMFARSHALTPTETRVLEALCRGLDPRDVCGELGVDMTTVRTHISAIRSKVGADSVSEVVRRVAVLPPVVGVLKGGV
jgi:DNA-binding CsgD family transcriptional regulator